MLDNLDDYVAAVMASSGTPSYSPVQLQKLFFVLDREIPDKVGGPRFNFTPYDYGPFDSSVYQVLERLIAKGFVARDGDSTHPGRTYILTPEGQIECNKLFATGFEDSERSYISEVAKFVQTCSFSELVTAIYKQYPDMKVNSVFSS